MLIRYVKYPGNTPFPSDRAPPMEHAGPHHRLWHISYLSKLARPPRSHHDFGVDPLLFEPAHGTRPLPLPPPSPLPPPPTSPHPLLGGGYL